MSLIRRALFKEKLNNVNVQPDWIQNNPTITSYIKNRPFYRECVSTQIVVQDKVWYSGNDDSTYLTKTDKVFLYSDVSYEVTINNISIECELSNDKLRDLDSGGDIFAVNYRDESGFLFDFYANKEYFNLFQENNAPSYYPIANQEITITENEYVYHQIDERYISGLGNKLDKRLGDEYAYKILATDEYGTIIAEERDIIRDDNISTGQILGLSKGIYYFKNLHEVYGTNGQYFLLKGLCQISDLGNNYKLFTLYDYGMKYRIDNNKAIVDMTPIYNQDIDYVINSSTEGSTKKFKITVDDSGTISATEVV